MLDTAYKKIVDVLQKADVGILVEDDYSDFKNFFARWEGPQLEGICITIEFVLMEANSFSGPARWIEFYCHFYTTKNRKKQKLLSSDDYRRLKNFLEAQVFFGDFEVIEYFNIKRDYRANRMRQLFINNEPGVIIMVGGLLTVKTNGGFNAVSTR